MSRKARQKNTEITKRRKEPMKSILIRYDVLDRVSCWCCCNKNLKELKNIYRFLPDYWQRLRYLQFCQCRPLKGFYK